MSNKTECKKVKKIKDKKGKDIEYIIEDIVI